MKIRLVQISGLPNNTSIGHKIQWGSVIDGQEVTGRILDVQPSVDGSVVGVAVLVGGVEQANLIAQVGAVEGVVDVGSERIPVVIQVVESHVLRPVVPVVQHGPGKSHIDEVELVAVDVVPAAPVPLAISA